MRGSYWQSFPTGSERGDAEIVRRAVGESAHHITELGVVINRTEDHPDTADLLLYLITTNSNICSTSINRVIHGLPRERYLRISLGGAQICRRLRKTLRYRRGISEVTYTFGSERTYSERILNALRQRSISEGGGSGSSIRRQLSPATSWNTGTLAVIDFVTVDCRSTVACWRRPTQFNLRISCDCREICRSVSLCCNHCIGSIARRTRSE
ncbi:unannotated protein [freshwater metagenome]|uniref:Unannotated protein n=1 Tax=freshwater metagenome TaxID=449393 RepID=A0A6J7BEQ5_9ZZZZ